MKQHFLHIRQEYELYFRSYGHSHTLAKSLSFKPLSPLEEVIATKVCDRMRRKTERKLLLSFPLSKQLYYHLFIRPTKMLYSIDLINTEFNNEWPEAKRFYDHRRKTYYNYYWELLLFNRRRYRRSYPDLYISTLYATTVCCDHILVNFTHIRQEYELGFRYYDHLKTLEKCLKFEPLNLREEFIATIVCNHMKRRTERKLLLAFPLYKQLYYRLFIQPTKILFALNLLDTEFNRDWPTAKRIYDKKREESGIP
ncbi:unnamed protein product [Didymodactylos carnosus]|uniref:Uncharacterized protein n=1 Tax=Didymodactylos carnosus TaxID=1234261 RepID=A0A815CJT4_9BILA|nr:unnamed protein product [Didymodactylos carnosus]CAF4083531.1 unnamed protein product [Didymodactylos carnosus]